uniref:Uncharacterized protein n=1 Tax=Anguilla anguilla TaxID=7936 RepID=A0A0E9U1G4_ANGAN
MNSGGEWGFSVYTLNLSLSVGIYATQKKQQKLVFCTPLQQKLFYIQL